MITTLISHFLIWVNETASRAQPRSLCIVSKRKKKPSSMTSIMKCTLTIHVQMTDLHCFVSKLLSHIKGIVLHLSQVYILDLIILT